MGSGEQEQTSSGDVNDQPSGIDVISGNTHTNTKTYAIRNIRSHVHVYTSKNSFEGGQPCSGAVS